MTPERTFDRIPRWDMRNENHRIRALTIADKPLRSYTWSVGTWLDQGSEGACVGFAVAHELAARPRRVAGITNATARAIYHDAKKIDDWPGEDYSGTSILAGVKVAHGQGHFTAYRWARTVDELAIAVGYAGPAVLGVNWHEGMFNPGPEGWIYPTGPVLGGHGILCYSVSVKGRYFKLWNSWGQGWGMDGTCRVSFDGMVKLLAEDGEAAVPMGRKVAS